MSFEDRIRIETPEGVDLELTLAGLGSRLGAATLDQLIKTAGNLAVLLVMLLALSSTDGAFGAVLFGFMLVVFFLIEFGYDVAFEVFGGGKTIGKRALGTRVVRTSGASVDFKSSAVRNLLRLVDGPMTFYALGTFMILFTKRNQRLGDLAAGTVVVRDRMPAPLPTDVLYEYASGDLHAWDVGRVDREAVNMLRGFLMRRDGLDPVVRLRIAQQIHDRVRPMVGGVAEEMSPEAFIEEVVRLKSQ